MLTFMNGVKLPWLWLCPHSELDPVMTRLKHILGWALAIFVVTTTLLALFVVVTN